MPPQSLCQEEAEGGEQKSTWPGLHSLLGEQSPTTLLPMKAAQVFFNFLDHELKEQLLNFEFI